jgi:hypothetical protein
MLDENEITWIHWDNSIQNRLIGRGTPYPTIRILVEYIVSIQNQIKEAKRIYEAHCEDIPNVWLEHSGTARGIEELGYKTYMESLKTKHEDAILSLNRFRTVSSQIPNLCGQVNCILDYIIHGVRWVDTEIRTNTIAQRMNKDNCIAYVNEANKLLGRGIRYHYE